MNNTKSFKDIKGYSIDHSQKKIFINYKLNKESNVFGSLEYEFLKALKNDFPEYKVVVKSGRKKTSANANKRFKYDNMRTYIDTFENSEELHKLMDIAIARSKKVASPYKYVCDWFNMQFPNHKEISLETTNEAVAPVALPKEEDYEAKEPAAWNE